MNYQEAVKEVYQMEDGKRGVHKLDEKQDRFHTKCHRRQISVRIRGVRVPRLLPGDAKRGMSWRDLSRDIT